MLVVWIFDKTLAFHSATASLTTAANSVPEGISLFTFRHAWSEEIHEMPTRDITSSSLKVKRAPIRTVSESEETNPPGCSTLGLAPAATNVLLLVALDSK